MKLVITHTPAQAKTLTDVLGDGWRVEPCYGMVRDLPANELGIALENDFRPTLTLAPGKGNLVRRLMKAIRECEAVYAATPPGADGEAMAWHVLALSPDAKDKPVYRVTLPALTLDAIRAAFASPRPLDMRQIEAHITRRIVERLIAWSVNVQAKQAVGGKPALTWAGMVALRLLAARESEIDAFIPQSTWQASVGLESYGGYFTARVFNARGEPLTMRNEEQAHQLETLLWHGRFWVSKTAQIIDSVPPPAALTPRTLIETAERELELTPDRVLSVVAMLYDAGWITHPGAELLPTFSEAAQAFIEREYGSEYADPAVSIRDAIAPSHMNRLPEDLPGDGSALYALIWKTFLAAQITSAQERVTGLSILVGATKGKPYPLELRAKAVWPQFEGWRRVLRIMSDDDLVLPSLEKGDTPEIEDIVSEKTVTVSPPRFTLAELVGALADSGWPIDDGVSTVDRMLTANYLTRDDALTLTDTGRALSAYLTEKFGELTDPQTVGRLHADIDAIASGERERLEVLRAFWSRFGAALRPESAVRAAGQPRPLVLRPAGEG